MPSDGDCMYRAIEHQLRLHQQQTVDIQALRRAAAQQLRAHRQEYLPFLISTQGDDVMGEVEYEHYCDQVEKTRCWGGNVELQALATHLDKEIQVIQANGPMITVKPIKTDDDRTNLENIKPLQLR